LRFFYGLKQSQALEFIAHGLVALTGGLLETGTILNSDNSPRVADEAGPMQEARSQGDRTARRAQHLFFNERGLRRILQLYFAYYERSRTHLSLQKDAPVSRPVQPACLGRVIELPQVGGLHHRYERGAA
jgi:hypothetical protein